MADNHEKNMYGEELEKVCSSTEPTDDDYDRILQSVMSAVGKPGTISFAEAEDRVRNLSRFRVIHRIGRAVTSRAGAVVIAAGLLLAILIGRAPPGDSLTVIPDHDIPLTSGPPLDKLPTARSRQYRVTEPVPVNSDDSASEAESPAEKDGDIPVMESFFVEGDILRIFLLDTGSGIAWDKVYASDLTGLPVQPVEIDEAKGMIGFSLPSETFELFLEDKGGNRAVVTVIAC